MKSTFFGTVRLTGLALASDAGRVPMFSGGSMREMGVRDAGVLETAGVGRVAAKMMDRVCV